LRRAARLTALFFGAAFLLPDFLAAMTISFRDAGCDDPMMSIQTRSAFQSTTCRLARTIGDDRDGSNPADA